MITNAYEISLKSFPIKKIGELCEIVGGISAPQDSEAFNEGIIPFVRMKDLGRYHLTRNLEKTDESLNKEFIKKENIRICPKGTILFPRSGSVHLNHRAILGCDAIIVSHIGGLIIKNNEISIDFLYWLLTQYDMRQIMNQTTGLNMIKFSDIAEVKIPVPPIGVQKKIVEWLNKIEDTLTMRKKADESTDALILSYYKNLFGNPFSNNKNFSICSLGEVSSLSMGGTPSTKNPEFYENGTINWMKSGDINNEFIYEITSKITQKGLEKSNAKMYKKGDVVIALNGQGKTRGTTAILRVDTTSNQSVIGISPINKFLTSEYLHYHLKQRYNEIRNLTGDNQRSGLNLKILRDMKIILPPIDLQNKFSDIVKKIEVARYSQGLSQPLLNKIAFLATEKIFSGKAS
ncbi:MAG: restriction endonuclease subunit S [Nanoarchaeota archaeon]|nr:restriction endonuclease subunit S [Nanoarchaeota archaeon]